MLGKKPPEQPRQRPLANDSLAPKPAYTYYAGQAKRREQPKAEKTIHLGSLNYRWRLVPSLIALGVIILSVLFSLTLSINPSVSFIEGQTSLYRDKDEYGIVAEQVLAQKFGNRSKLGVNTVEFEQAYLEKFPELQAAKLRLPILGRRPTLVLDIRQPAALLTTPGKSFVLDTTGTAVSEIQHVPEEFRKNLLVINDQSGLDIKLGKQAVTSSSIEFIQAFVAQCKAANLSVKQMTLPAQANQLDIRFDGVPYYVKTDIGGDARLQAGSLLAVKNNLDGQGIVPAEYIDVRVEEKVFYK